DFLDTTEFYANPVAREDRSRMNVPFTLRDAKLDEEFLKGTAKEGMVQLKGHRSVGGMRASIYNAMPLEGVQRLVDYMKEFEKKHRYGLEVRDPGDQPDRPGRPQALSRRALRGGERVEGSLGDPGALAGSA